ncbi:MAG: hypothetical protein JJE03_04135 [Peptostreptococcaceae bacterium]|nr:hypothetical protein [Peptostreptococcaceae bacterium]
MLAIFRNILKKKTGEELIEASITMPIIILITMLLIRLTVFFYDVLNTGVELHQELINQSKEFDKCYVKVIEEERDLALLSEIGINIKVYGKEHIFSEGKVVMAGDLIEK